MPCVYSVFYDRYVHRMSTCVYRHVAVRDLHAALCTAHGVLHADCPFARLCCTAMRCAHPAARRVDCTLLPVSNAPSSFVFITVTCVTFDELTQLVVAACAYTLLDAYRPVQSPRPVRGACAAMGAHR